MIRAMDPRLALTRAFVKRDLASRYKNSVLGWLWLLGQPLLQLALYSFVFGLILRTRWGITNPSGEEVPFGLILFSGILLHGVLAETLTRGPGLILGYPAYVKRVVFPLEIIPLSSALGATWLCTVGMALLLVAHLIVVQTAHLTWLLIPLPLAMVFLMALALAQLLGALGVFFRDLAQLSSHLSTIALFTAPICFPSTIVPEGYRWLFQINPLTVPVETLHELLFAGTLPPIMPIVAHIAATLIILMITRWIFNRLRAGFADAV